MAPVKANNLDLSKVSFSDVKTDQHGRKMVYINMNGKIMVQTPKMYAPNGIKRWRKADATNNKDDKFEMELSFYGENGSDSNANDIRNFKEKLEQFDELIKNKVVENAKEWLGLPKLDMNTLESVMYTPMVRVPKDKQGNILEYPCRVKAKIDREIDSNGNPTGRFLSNKKFKTEVMLFDENKEQIHLDENNCENAVPKGSQVICILELVYLTLSKTVIATKWKLVQAKVFPNKDSITGYALLDDTDANAQPNDLDTENENETQAEGEVEVVEDNSSDEAEDEDVEVEKPAPAKPKGRAKRAVAV